MASRPQAAHISEAALIRAAQDRDHNAFEQLVRLHDRNVLRVAMNLLRSKEDARDAYQETFLRAYPNSGVRLETLDALRHKVDDREVRLALREAMVHDRNPGVRLKAFEALRVHHGEPDIREALQQVLRHDEIPGMRIQVIDSLTEESDGELVGLLQELVESDENRYVRLKCRRTLR